LVPEPCGREPCRRALSLSCVRAGSLRYRRATIAKRESGDRATRTDRSQGGKLGNNRI